MNRSTVYGFVALLGLLFVSWVMVRSEPCLAKGGVWQQITATKECLRAVDDARHARYPNLRAREINLRETSAECRSATARQPNIPRGSRPSGADSGAAGRGSATSDEAVKVLALVLTHGVAGCKPLLDPLRRRASRQESRHQLVGVLQTDVIVA
jgi:hypothetical protein